MMAVFVPAPLNAKTHRVHFAAGVLAEALPAIAYLNNHTGHAGLHYVAVAGCEQVAPKTCAEVVAHHGVVYLVLHVAGHAELDRRLPWLVNAERGLVATAVAGQLDALLVVLEGLLAEAHLTQRAQSPVPSPVRKVQVVVAPAAPAARPMTVAAPMRVSADVEAAPKALNPIVVMAPAFESVRTPVASPARVFSGLDVTEARVPHLRNSVQFEAGLGAWSEAASSYRPDIRAAVHWRHATAALLWEPAMAVGSGKAGLFGGSLGGELPIVTNGSLALGALGALTVARQAGEVTGSTRVASGAPQLQPHDDQPPPPPDGEPPLAPETQVVTTTDTASAWYLGPSAGLQLSMPLGDTLHAGLLVETRWLWCATSTLPQPEDAVWQRGLAFGLRLVISHGI